MNLSDRIDWNLLNQKLCRMVLDRGVRDPDILRPTIPRKTRTLDVIAHERNGEERIVSFTEAELKAAGVLHQKGFQIPWGKEYDGLRVIRAKTSAKALAGHLLEKKYT